MSEKELEKIFKQEKEKKQTKKNGKVVITPGFVTTTFPQFQAWFKQDVFDKGCFYCGLTNSESLALYNKRYHATRGGKRGKRLELDRKDPSMNYDLLDNLVWCCYWCNNAKSNFFSANEFMPIAKAIGNALRQI